MDIYSSFATRFEKTREEELSLEEYPRALQRRSCHVCNSGRTHVDGHRENPSTLIPVSIRVYRVCLRTRSS